MKNKLLFIALCLGIFAYGTISAAAETYGSLTYQVTDGEVTITDCDTSIGGKLTIPDTIDGYPVTAIGDSAFYNCKYLTGITIPDSVTTIGKSAFLWCSYLGSVDMPDSLATIGDSAFYDSGILNIEIPDTVTSIGKQAFMLCENLSAVSIPESVITIGEEAFAGCDCLRSIDVDESNPNYMSSDGVLYDKAQITILQCPATRTSFTLPDSVTIIGNSAFYGCDSLTAIDNFDGVTAIGESAFQDCKSLLNIKLPNGITTIPEYALYGCESLKSVVIPEGVTTIGGFSFYMCTGLSDIKIPDSVATICKWAFYHCDSLESISFSKNLTAVEDFAFWNCDNLLDIYYGGSEDEWKKISLGGYNYPLQYDATIHFLEPAQIKTGNVQVEDSGYGYSFTVSSNTNGEFVIAVFDGNRFLGFDSQAVSGGEVSGTIQIDQVPDSYRAFIWGSLTGATSVCPAVSGSIE